MLDTNVLSELMRDKPANAVLDWFAQNAGSLMHISAVTQAEILTGIALLPESKRRTALAVAAELMFEQDFAGHCLAFDAVAASNHAVIVSERTRQGHPITTEDAQIAATALANALTVATRNTADFKNIRGLEIVTRSPSSRRLVCVRSYYICSYIRRGRLVRRSSEIKDKGDANLCLS
jgi:predicted nucleic acid-binding protein